MKHFNEETISTYFKGETQQVFEGVLDTTPKVCLPRIAKFEKVSYEQFKNDMLKHFGSIFEDNETIIEQIYDNIKLPKRATADSAGYDFYAPVAIKPTPTAGIVIPTGIRCKMEPGWVLKIYPRSGQGFKYGVHLYNSVGVIDGDYYFANNEGHIMVKIASKDTCDIIPQGTGFCQGILTPYGITVDDETTEIRTGGFGSTSK